MKTIHLILNIIVILIFCISCKNTPTGTQTDNPDAENPNEEFEGSLFNVMSYNIYWGAGNNEVNINQRAQNGLKPEAIQDVIQIIDSLKLSIVGIQEAVRWEANEDSVLKYVANQLNMNYALGPGTFASWGWNVVTLTTFEILKIEYPKVSNNGTLYTMLKTNEGDTLHVYNVHFNPFSQDKRLEEFYIIMSKMEEHPGKYRIIMGDFNFVPDDNHFPPGWQKAAQSRIDNIYCSPEIDYTKRIDIFSSIDLRYLLTISDHYPVASTIGIENE